MENNIKITVYNHNAIFFKPFIFEWLQLLLKYVLVSEIPTLNPLPVHTLFTISKCKLLVLLNSMNYNNYYELNIPNKMKDAIDLVVINDKYEFNGYIDKVIIKYIKYDNIYSKNIKIINIPFLNSDISIKGNVNESDMNYNIILNNPLINITPIVYTTFLSLFTNNFSLPYGDNIDGKKLSNHLILSVNNMNVSLSSTGYCGGLSLNPLIGLIKQLDLILDTDSTSGDMKFNIDFSYFNFLYKDYPCIHIDEYSKINLNYYSYNDWIDRKMIITMQDANIMLLSDVMSHIYQVNLIKYSL